VDVIGHSMEPTIPDGAVILVNRANKEPRDRMVFALRVGDELFVKRLVNVKGEWLARSDNEDREQYPDLPLSSYQDVEILGRALWMGARL
ncbi:MAG: helix-turn-helix transcriptional regulator, partial [Comamonadaceae bacterium]